VVLSNRRGPDSLADVVAELGNGASAATAAVAASLDYVLLAVPWPHIEDVLRGLPAWNGRVLIDATNNPPRAPYRRQIALHRLQVDGRLHRAPSGNRGGSR
jgi:predicted dinucleotide-binding enzyme